jgi:hypothetical protein
MTNVFLLKSQEPEKMHLSIMSQCATRRKIIFSFFLYGEGLRGALSKNSHKISDSIPRICQNDASKLAPSLHARHNPRLTAREPDMGLMGALK